jgi:hypothetical protein
MAQTHTTGPRPQVEQLEARRLLTGNITLNPVSGVVTVEGSPQHDRFTVTSTPDGGVRLRLRGGAWDTALFSQAQVKKLVYHGNRGRDQVVNFTAVPLERIPPAPLTQPDLPPTPPTPTPPPAPAGSEAPFGDHYLDPAADGKSMESWSAPGRPARVSIFFDPKTLTADEVARLRDAVTALNGLHTGLTLVPTSSPTAQIVVEGKPTSPDGLTLSWTLPGVGARIGTFPNGKKDYQLTHVEIDVFQNMPWWFGPGAPPTGSYTLDFRSTMEHELGHAVGLDHDTATYPVNDGFGVLYPVAAPGVARWTYSANDGRELTYLYGGH